MPDLGIASIAADSVPSTKDMFNSFSTMATNFMNQKFAKRMYQRQYDDSIRFWNMQNEYNTPAMQMQRFKDAGLNPNLVYGRGESGNAGNIPTPSAPSVNFRAPQFEGGRPDLMSNLLAQADLRIKAAQADNLETQNDVIIQDAQLRALQAEHEGFRLDFDRDMRDISSDYKREQLRQLTNTIDLALNKDARDAAATSQSIAESMERVLNLRESRKNIPFERLRISADTDLKRQQIESVKRDGTLKDIEIKLRDNGINPSDPMWARYIAKFLEDWMDDTKNPNDKGFIWKYIFGK